MCWLASTVLASTALALEPQAVWVRIADAQDWEEVRALGFGFAEARKGDLWLFHGEAPAVALLRSSELEWRHAPSGPPPPGDPNEAARELTDLEARRPDLVRLVTMGRSIEGRDLSAVRVSASDAPRAEWRIAGGHHGDETIGVEVALGLARSLVSESDSDPDVAAILDRDAVWIVPVVNPDGYAAGSRYNARDVDLNRNYGWEWDPAEFRPGTEPFSEPETRAMRALAAWTPFAGGLAVHAGAANLGWVWNWTTNDTPDEALLEAHAQTYAQVCEVEGFRTTNGADWYTTNGDCNDWSYGRWGTLDYTLEVSESKSLSSEDADSLFAAHRDSMVAWMSWPDVVSGRVVDADTGHGIPAWIAFVEGGWGTETGPDGRFARVVESGTWTIEATAPGYEPAFGSAAPGENVTIALSGTSLAEGRPEPAILSRGGPGTFRVPFETDSVRLVRPGEEDEPADSQEDGRWHVDVTSLAPGPWSIVTDGAAIPRALFVGEVDDEVRIEEVGLRGDDLVVVGGGFGAGSRAFALWGTDRAPVELDLASEEADELQFDAGVLSDTDGPVDLLVVSSGRQVAAADVLGPDPGLDTAARSDTGVADDPSSSSPRAELRTACGGCASTLPRGGLCPPSGSLPATRGAAGTPVFVLVFAIASLMLRRLNSESVSRGRAGTVSYVMHSTPPGMESVVIRSPGREKP